MTGEGWLLLVLIALGSLGLAAFCIGWIADHHITTTDRHRRKDL